MADYTLTTFLVVMLTISVGLGLYTDSVKSYNPLFDGNDFNFSSTSASRMTITGELSSGIDEARLTDSGIYDPADSVNPETGESFTDTYKTTSKFLNFLQTSWTIISSLFLEPARFMISMNIPSAYAVAIQIIWNGIILLLLLQFRKGGS